MNASSIPCRYTPQGWFAAGTVGNACADPKYVEGCIFWIDPTNTTRHFVDSCDTAPCGANACGAGLHTIGSGILQFDDSPAHFDCSMWSTSCDKATAASCDAPETAALSAVEKLCLGQTSCSIPASAAVFGTPTCRGAVSLGVVASGCTAAPAPLATVYVFDFGQSMSGVATLQLPTAAMPGTAITLKYAEVLKSDSSGTVKMDWCNGNEADACVCPAGAINCANQTDRVILSGNAAKDGTTFTPSFTYHGYRYVQVEGLHSAPTADTLTANFVHTAVRETGKIKFNASLDILNKIQTAIKYTQLSNFHSHPTDCPTREKRGWTGDSQITSAGASMNFDTGSFYDNWLQVFGDHQDVGCALHGKEPVFPQGPADKCCNPKVGSFGCDYSGIPDGPGGFNETSGSIADVVPFTYVCQICHPPPIHPVCG